MRGECGGRWTRVCCSCCRSLVVGVVLVLFCPDLWATRGARLGEIQASSISQDAVEVTRMRAMLGVEAAVPGVRFQRALRRKPRLAPACDRPFAMPRLISNVAWFAERLGPAVSGDGLPKRTGPLFAYGNIHLSDILQYLCALTSNTSNCSIYTGTCRCLNQVPLSHLCVSAERSVSSTRPRGELGILGLGSRVTHSSLSCSQGWTHSGQWIDDLLIPAELVVYHATRYIQI